MSQQSPPYSSFDPTDASQFDSSHVGHVLAAVRAVVLAVLAVLAVPRVLTVVVVVVVVIVLIVLIVSQVLTRHTLTATHARSMTFAGIE